MKNTLRIFLPLLALVTIASIVSASEVTGNLNTGINTPGVIGTVIVPPTAVPDSGTYGSAQVVVLSASGSNSIHYTMDGTDPTCLTGITFSAAIQVPSSTTIKAVSCYSGNHSSPVTPFTYTVQTQSFGGGGISYSPQSLELQKGKVLGLTTDSHPNGTLVLDGQTIFLIKDGKRAGFRNQEEYFSHGYNFDQAVPANDVDRALPEGSIIKALEGTLVIDAADNRTVNMVGLNGTKRGFTSEKAFAQLGYTFNGLLTINLSDYAKGDDITEHSQVHPEGALVLEGQTVWWLRGGQRMGFESKQVFNTYGFTFGRVVTATAGDLALVEGEKVKFRDGTLVRHSSNVYVISDAKKLMFETTEALINGGYKAENVIDGEISGYEDGETLN